MDVEGGIRRMGIGGISERKSLRKALRTIPVTLVTYEGNRSQTLMRQFMHHDLVCLHGYDLITL